MKTKVMLSAVGLGLLVACGGNSISGTVQGTSLSPQEAIFLILNGSNNSQGMIVIMSDQKGQCDKLKANNNSKNTTGLGLFLITTDSSGNALPLATGSFKVTTSSSTSTGGNEAFASFSKTDSGCNETLSPEPTGTDGTVTLSSFSAKTGGTASGTFDVKFSSDHVTGNFNAAWCDATINLFGSSAGCQ